MDHDLHWLLTTEEEIELECAVPPSFDESNCDLTSSWRHMFKAFHFIDWIDRRERIHK